MVKMRESNQQIMSELLSLVKQRQKSGVATGMDIARLDAQLANEKQLAASSRYDLQHAKLNLMAAQSAVRYAAGLAGRIQGGRVRALGISDRCRRGAHESARKVQAQFTRVKATVAYVFIHHGRAAAVAGCAG